MNQEPKVFPLIEGIWATDGSGYSFEHGHEGLTLRDLLAGWAMIALLVSDRCDPETVSAWAYRVADQMLHHRQQASAIPTEEASS